MKIITFLFLFNYFFSIILIIFNLFLIFKYGQDLKFYQTILIVVRLILLSLTIYGLKNYLKFAIYTGYLIAALSFFGIMGMEFIFGLLMAYEVSLVNQYLYDQK